MALDRPNKMKNVYYTAKLGLDRITSSMLLVLARNMVTKITGNAAFTTPTPPLATVTAAADDLEAAINAFELNRGPGEHTDRELAFMLVKGLVTDLGAYVQSASNGDLDLIKSAGLAVRKTGSPLGQLPAPKNLFAKPTAYPGRVELAWGGVRGRGTYTIEHCLGDPNLADNWKAYAITSKNRFTASGLASDKEHYFRVTAVGAAGASPVSDSASAKAA